ncbi:oxidation resistance protein 1-like [Paramacrobiotus metropolitanus]|uniref:oxidation resistance protein 1-like n=1 Tax=Paramacrobiotus metropolitanus TaxID=2943436 RepID=UPI0024463E0B|nr:oxidation resistance protein 1-like [Paramacrobiotus metropolitanus]
MAKSGGFIAKLHRHFHSSDAPDAEEKRKTSIQNAPLPELRGQTEILTELIRKTLIPELPSRARFYPWTLVYNTAIHGFSLKTLYRKMLKIESPTLLIVRDVQDHTFGAIVSCALKVAEHFYGTGESALFSFTPEFRIYNWCSNSFIVRGLTESIAIGSGGGTFGLWLDSDLNRGRTQTCETFENDPLCSCGDFIIKNLEAWCFLG